MSHSVVYYCCSGRRSKLVEFIGVKEILSPLYGVSPFGSSATFSDVLVCRHVPKHLRLLFNQHGGLGEGGRENFTSHDCSFICKGLTYCWLLHRNPFWTLLGSCRELWSTVLGGLVPENPGNEPAQFTSINLWTTHQEHSYAGNTTEKMLCSYSCYRTTQG